MTHIHPICAAFAANSCTLSKNSVNFSTCSPRVQARASQGAAHLVEVKKDMQILLVALVMKMKQTFIQFCWALFFWSVPLFVLAWEQLEEIQLKFKLVTKNTASQQSYHREKVVNPVFLDHLSILRYKKSYSIPWALFDTRYISSIEYSVWNTDHINVLPSLSSTLDGF